MAGASRPTSPGWCGRGCWRSFPQLADVAIEHAWGGTLAITVNRMPAFQRLGAGGLLGRRLFRARGGAGDAGGQADGRGGAGDGGAVRRARRAAAAALSRRGGAALAAPGAGDELVRAAGPALMPLWVAISLAAAFLQNLRTALQKALTPRVGVIGATYARFLFAAPWAVLLVAVLVLREGRICRRRRRRSWSGGWSGRWRRSGRRCCCCTSSAAELRGRQHLRQDRDGAGGAVRARAARRPGRGAGARPGSW